MNGIGSKNDDEESQSQQELSVQKTNPSQKTNSKAKSNKNRGDSSPNGQSDNSYVDFIKSLGWGNSSASGGTANIPHLDIYFMNNMSKEESDAAQGNFLEMDEKTKMFTPDLEYIKKINDPSNGYLWKAKVYDEFVGKSYFQMRTLLGNSNSFKAIPNRKSHEEENSNFLEFEVKVKEVFN